MNADELGEYLDRHFHQPGDRLFRMEVLPAYAVDSDGDDYERWLDGATEPTWSRKQPWLDTLRGERANGQISTMINDDTVVPMTYDGRGRFVNAHVADRGEVAAYVRTRDVAWAAAEPFVTWWARHPELHRRRATQAQ